MEWWRKGIVILIGLTLVGVTILTWGSMGSIITLCCLGSMIAFLLLQKFMINRDCDDFQTEV